MQTLPYANPGTPDLAGPWRFLGWIARLQWQTLVVGMLWGIANAVSQALIPVAVGRGIDAVIAHDRVGLAWWSGSVLALAAVQAGSGVLRHRWAVANWLQSSFRVAQLLGYQAANAGEALPRTIATGEVVSTVSNDAMRLGGAFDTSARFMGAIVSYLVVAAFLVRTSWPLGLLVLIGVPALTAFLGLLVGPLQRRQAVQRAAAGRLTTLGADTVAGLRVLRGIGGEETFVARYRTQSQTVRRAGVRAGTVEAALDAAQVLLPGILVVAITWWGGRMVVRGELSIGSLVVFYGLTAYLVTPLRTATEMVDKVTRAKVGSIRILEVLRVTPLIVDRVSSSAAGASSRVELDPNAALVDPGTGAVIAPGSLTAVVCEQPEASAALADRLGRFSEDPLAPVLLGDQRIDVMSLAAVRRHIVVSETEPRLFTGQLRAQLIGPNTDTDAADTDARLAQALHTAAAEDVLLALPAGLASEVEERGRSFSGGQRQRLSLARALLTESPVLILVEPTSAVDAHTEAAIATRLREHRQGRTTVVMTASPLLLEQADQVIFLADNKVSDTGTHRTLLATNPDYHQTVLRGESA
jgi:ABC-type multidrug transport system fused ATPase/permease subunit